MCVGISALVALFTNEATAERIANWVAEETRPLVSGDWCETEFASALALKQRTSQITSGEGNAAWKVFGQFCEGHLRLLPLDRDVFSQAAQLVRNSKNGLRAGDALHLAAALRVKDVAFFTLDVRLEESAGQRKLPVIH